jgi:hypothetical protein
VAQETEEPKPESRAPRGTGGEWRDRGGPGPRAGGGQPAFERLRDPAVLKAWLEKLKEEDPELVERLVRLREENPEQFKVEVRDVALRRFREFRSEPANPAERKCLELSRQYSETKDLGEKEKLKAELREVVEAAFDSRLKGRLERVEAMKREIQRLQEQLEERKNAREKIVEARVEELTRDPGLRWDWEAEGPRPEGHPAAAGPERQKPE